MKYKASKLKESFSNSKLYVESYGEDVAELLSAIFGTSVEYQDFPYIFIKEGVITWGASPKEFNDSDLPELDLDKVLDLEVIPDDEAIRVVGHFYYYLEPDFKTKCFRVYKALDNNDTLDDAHFKYGNYFNTKEDALEFIKKNEKAVR